MFAFLFDLRCPCSEEGDVEPPGDLEESEPDADPMAGDLGRFGDHLTRLTLGAGSLLLKEDRLLIGRSLSNSRDVDSAGWRTAHGTSWASDALHPSSLSFAGSSPIDVPVEIVPMEAEVRGEV